VSTLVILEQIYGGWHRMSWEALAAAQQMDGPVWAAVAGGANVNTLAADLAGKRLDRAWAVSHQLLTAYTADGYTAALAELIRREQPDLVLLPHTYQVRDFAPKLAARLGRTLVSDVVRIRRDDQGLVFTRQLFQGKLNADYRAVGPGPHFASIQAGACRADQVQAGTAAVEAFTPELDASMIRAAPQDPFREAQRAVDLTAAELIVSVGRGIKEQENIALVQDLAEALGAEFAASRPICDAGWLPMERQVGSSGQTVSPKVYFAVGISGAIQHLVGMKGSKCVVAINKDPNAPIFEIADYGVAADLFEFVPELTEQIRKLRG